MHVHVHTHARAYVRAYAVGIYSSGEAPRSPSRRNLTKERRAKNRTVKIEIFAAIAEYTGHETVKHYANETG